MVRSQHAPLRRGGAVKPNAVVRRVSVGEMPLAARSGVGVGVNRNKHVAVSIRRHAIGFVQGGADGHAAVFGIIRGPIARHGCNQAAREIGPVKLSLVSERARAETATLSMAEAELVAAISCGWWVVVCADAVSKPSIMPARVEDFVVTASPDASC